MIDIPVLMGAGVIGSSSGNRPLNEKERRKLAERRKRAAEKEAKAAKNRKLWKKYFGIDAEKIHEKYLANKRSKDEELRQYGFVPESEAKPNENMTVNMDIKLK